MPHISAFGAVGDGTTDDTSAFQAAANAGGYYELESSRTYRITSRITIEQSNTGFYGNGTPRVWMDPAAFSNQQYSSSLSNNACGFLFAGLTSGTFAPIWYSRFSGITVFMTDSTPNQNNYLTAVAMRNVVNMEINDYSAYGFAAGYGLRLDTIRGLSSVRRNYIHHFYTNYTTSNIMQSTGISVDADRVDGINSTSIKMLDNRIERIELGPTAIAQYGNQTDGINVCSVGGGFGIEIAGNFIGQCAEGIDHWGSEALIHHNNIQDSAYFGIKLIHGASRNKIDNNLIVRAGHAGVVLAGSNTVGSNHCEGNIINDNLARGMNYQNNGYQGICYNEQNATNMTSKVQNNTYMHNIAEPGSTGRYAFGPQGTGCRWERNVMKSGTSGVQSGTTGSGTTIVNA
jgi:hypothetical protein